MRSSTVKLLPPRLEGALFIVALLTFGGSPSGADQLHRL
jgi:hypothetical protein